MNETKEIIIDLERSKYPNINHGKDELIQQEAIEKLKKHMKRVVDEYNDSKKRYRPEYKTFKELKENESDLQINENEFMEYAHFRRKHEAIALLGERGTGKTNFLVNLKNILGQENLAYLKILDPTLFEDRQNILVAIISQLKDLVIEAGDGEDKVKKAKCCYEKLYPKWEKTLQNLAEGLNLIDDHIGSNPMEKDMWDDARLVMQKGLQASKSGYRFEEEFHILLSYTLQMIEKKAIILRFDDIDTNPEKGWNVLEVIRKYLTTPHLQIIISGDWGLYSRIVRKKQWQHFKELIDLDKNYDRQKQAVDDMEEQYLTKILKPEYRIYLRTLRHIDADSNYILIVKKKNQEKTNIEKYLFGHHSLDFLPTVKNIYMAIFKDVFNLSNNLLENSCAMMMTLPLRTNLQTIKEFENSISVNNDGSSVINKFKFMGSFTNVFLTVLDRFEFSYRDFRKLFEPSGYGFLTNKIYDLSKRNKEFSFGEMITPQVVLEDDKANLFLLFVYGFVAQSMNQNVSLIFDWHYRVRMLSRLIGVYNDETLLQNARMFLDYRNKISTYKITIKYSGLLIKTLIEEDESIKSSSTNEKVKNELQGFAYLYSRERQNKIGSPLIALDTFNEKIDGGYYTIDEEKKLFMKFLLSVVLKGINNKEGKEVQVLTSIHYLLGFLSNTLNNKDILGLPRVMSYLNTLKEFKSGQNTDSRIAYGDHIYDEEQFKKHFKSGESSLIKFNKKLDDWKKYVSSKNKILNFSLEQIDDMWNEFDNAELNIGYVASVSDYLELQIYVFLNALLKTAQERKKIVSFEPIVNIDVAKEHFASNLKKYYNNFEKANFGSSITKLRDIISYVKGKKEINIFEFYLICPLWEYYIDFEYESAGNIGNKNLFDHVDENNKSKVIFDSDEVFYSSAFKELAVRTTDKVIDDINKNKNVAGKTHKKIIEENFNEIDESNLHRSLYEFMVSIKNELGYKKITNSRIKQWEKIYNEIKNEKSR